LASRAHLAYLRGVKIVALLALFGSGCCGGFGETCDPETYVAHCDGAGYRDCQWGHAYGFDTGHHLAYTACLEGDACVDRGQGEVGCVRAPATPCDRETFVGRCEGDVPIQCAPSDRLAPSYELAEPACSTDRVCAVVEGVARCVTP
jgi:hypothetical protein